MSSARRDFELWLPAMEELALDLDVEFLTLIRKQLGGLPLGQFGDAWQMQFWGLAQHMRDVAPRLQDAEVLARARLLLEFLHQGIRFAASLAFRRAVDHFCIADIFEIWSAELQRRGKAVDVASDDEE